MPRQRYIAVGNKWVPIEEYQRPVNNSAMVMPDIKPYKSVITGETIGSRSTHREHLRVHNCVEVGNEFVRPPKPDITAGLREDLIRAYKRNTGKD